jgi:hypothetical protein
MEGQNSHHESKTTPAASTAAVSTAVQYSLKIGERHGRHFICGAQAAAKITAIQLKGDRLPEGALARTGR